MNTSPERVDAVARLSGRLHEALDQPVEGRTRADKILDLGVNAVGYTLRGTQSDDTAGRILLSITHDQLERSGLGVEDPAYIQWPRYQAYIRGLKKAPAQKRTELNTFARQYGAVERATLTTSHEKETNARHAVHLMGWAVPYAMEMYPSLNPNKVALYALNHDGIEAITGDTPSLDLSPMEHAAKVAKETAALFELEALIGEQFPQLFSLIKRYESLADREAEFVKTADKADPGFTHFKTRGLALVQDHQIQSAEEFYAKIDVVTRRIMSYAHHFPEFLHDRDELTRRIAHITEWPH